MKLKVIENSDTSQYVISIGDDNEFLSPDAIYVLHDLYIKSECDEFNYTKRYDSNNIHIMFFYYNKTNIYGIKYFVSWCKKNQVELILPKIAPPDFSGIKSVTGNIRVMEITKQKKIETIYRDWDVAEKFGK